MAALKAHVEVKIDSLCPLLDLYRQKSLEERYKENFPWVDQLAEVKDSKLKDRLNGLLLGELRSEDTVNCWLTPPEIVDWGRIQGFKYSESRRAPTHFDVHLQSFVETVRDRGSLNAESLKRRRVLVIGDDDSIQGSWPVYKCLYCEVAYEDKSYVLSEGRWYNVAEDFLEAVNLSYDQLPRYERPLPAFDDDSETLYNERIAREHPGRFALLDRKMIQVDGGRVSVELCDLMSSDYDLFHVKRYRSSSSLSHLFAQGLVSAECFLADSRFRRQLNTLLPKEFRLIDPETRPDVRDYRIIYAIISRATGELKVPFFSRLTIRHAARRLRGFGYRLALAKIEVDPVRAALKRYS